METTLPFFPFLLTLESNNTSGFLDMRNGLYFKLLLLFFFMISLPGQNLLEKWRQNLVSTEVESTGRTHTITPGCH